MTKSSVRLRLCITSRYFSSYFTYIQCCRIHLLIRPSYRLINLVAEDNAIEDTIYHLHRALNVGRIDLERFLRVRPFMFFLLPLTFLRFTSYHSTLRILNSETLNLQARSCFLHICAQTKPNHFAQTKNSRGIFFSSFPGDLCALNPFSFYLICLFVCFFYFPFTHFHSFRHLFHPDRSYASRGTIHEESVDREDLEWNSHGWPRIYDDTNVI